MAKVTKQVKPVLGAPAAKLYEGQLDQERARLQQSGQAFQQQLQQQASAPTLAKSQLEAANKRSLAQTLAAAQNFGTNPGLQRQIRQQTGLADRLLAQQANIGGMAEQQAAQNLMMQQAAQQQAAERANMLAGFNIARTPADIAAQQELDRFNAANAKYQQQLASGSQAIGSLIGTLNAAAIMSDKNQKENVKSAKKPIAKFMDQLEKLSRPEPNANMEEVLKQIGKSHAKLKKMESK